MLSVATTCPYCACGCGLYLLANRGELVGVAPSENHPVSQGRLCARGWSAHEAPSWGGRLRTPLIRKNGRSESASWSAAMDMLASEIGRLMHEGKAIGVLGSPRATNEENYLAGKLARAALGTSHLDFCLHSSFRPLMAGLEDVTGAYCGAASLADVEAADAILLMEGDLARAHPRAAYSVMRAVDRGARLITIGCASTQMARLSAVYLPAAPGCSGDVIDGLLGGVVAGGLEDRGSVSAWCDGYEALASALSPAEQTEQLRQAVEWIARANRATFLLAPSGASGEQLRRDAAAVASLAGITGHLDRQGSGIMLLLGRSNLRGACEMGVAAGRLPGYLPLADRSARDRLCSLWGKELAAGTGGDAESFIESVSGLIVVADDPASALPAGRRAQAAMEKMEFLVVLDAFVTAAVEMAHVVLPIASYAETDGTLTSLEGRVQRCRAAADPPGEARAGWQALAELCSRFGLSAPYRSSSEVLAEIGAAVPVYAPAGQAGEGWGGAFVGAVRKPKANVCASGSQPITYAEYPHVLAHEGVIDWGKDPLVAFSPTLNREHRSRARLNPQGLVEISKHDADQLGLRSGWHVRVESTFGDVVLPAVIRPELSAGVLLVPYAFRDHAAAVFAGRDMAAVKVERV
ncbi:MAG: molybdopterin-dependent oxidoreductase [Acidobacteriota bacterium]